MFVKLDLSQPEVLQGQEVHLNLWYSLNTCCQWADPGHELGWDQFRIREFEKNTEQKSFSIQTHHTPGPLISKTYIQIKSDLGGLCFDTNSGRLKHFRFKNLDVLASSPRLNV